MVRCIWLDAEHLSSARNTDIEMLECIKVVSLSLPALYILAAATAALVFGGVIGSQAFPRVLWETLTTTRLETVSITTTTTATETLTQSVFKTVTNTTTLREKLIED